MEQQPNLGKRISGLRKAKNLTQEELAEQCKVSARTLQRIESGVVTPRAYTVRAIFTALGCEPDDSPGDLKKDDSPMRRHFEQAYKYLKDLFNLKTNTMKKVSILSVFALAVSFGLFALCSESKAQANKYVKDNSRGIVVLRPKGLLGYGQYYRNDTLFLHAGKDLIKEWNGNMYLNDQYAGHADDGDTIILSKATIFKKARLEFKRVDYQKIPGNTGIIYFFPKHLPLEMQNDGIVHYRIGKNEIMEIGNQIFFNGTYQGEAFANDTVILKPRGTLIIKTTKRE